MAYRGEKTDCRTVTVNNLSHSLTRSGNNLVFHRKKRDPMIATSMALLPTGADLDREEALIQSGLIEALSEGRRAVGESDASKDVQILDSALLLDSSGLLLDRQSSSSDNPIGNFSPVYSPLSTASADSGVAFGVGGELPSPDSDTFLAELFGSSFPLLAQTSSTLASLSAPNVNPTPSVKNTDATLVRSVHSKPMLTQGEEQTTHSVDVNGTCDEPQVERNRKNAEAARQNRLKKKRYLEELEKEHSDTKRENVILKTKCHEYQQRCLKLQAEVEYLKNVIANESMLSNLIQNIPSVPNVKLSSSFSSRKRPHTGNAKDKDGLPASKKSKTLKDTVSGGVCLHVAKDLVSLEFCQHCSKQAAQS